MRPILFAALLALVATPAGARVWTRSFDVAARPTVRIVTGDPDVHIHTRDGGRVEFRVEFERQTFGFATPSSPEPRITYEQHGDTITITVREPRSAVTIGFSSVRQSIDVTMPVAANLSIQTGDGAVTCDPIKGETRIVTGDGAIRVMGLEGAIQLEARDGSIRGENLQGRLEARTTDGGITVDGRFDRLDVRTQDGPVRAVVRPGSRVAESWSLATGDGSLSLQIPTDFAAMLDLHTGDGSLTVDLPIPTRGRLRQHDLTGALNGGRGLLRMRSGDGAMTLSTTE